MLYVPARMTMVTDVAVPLVALNACAMVKYGVVTVLPLLLSLPEALTYFTDAEPVTIEV
jgi:hypothetical protein